MKVLSFAGREDIAMVYLAEMEDGKVVEFIESVQPPLPRDEKWVIIISTLFGCPVGCPICDAGSFYQGKLTKQEIFDQIDFLVTKRFGDKAVAVKKFKIQFARMGEPALNMNVLAALEELPYRYDAPGLLPCISTVAPLGTDEFFGRLIEIKKKLYRGRFQLQFSIHSTDEKLRAKFIPVRKWDFARIAQFGNRYFQEGDRKITLNFALEKESAIDPHILRKHFDPDIFLIKITPLNPTYRAARNGLSSYIDPNRQGDGYKISGQLRSCGYDVIVSIGEVEENKIGSNCGQYVMRHLKEKGDIKDAYAYEPQGYS
jgi:23S rRNA (adenine2503-C2)-methyltransferase